VTEAELTLEPPIAAAIAAARAWNQANPDERLPRELIEDVYRSYGPRPVFVDEAHLDRILPHRPDLAALTWWGRIAIPEDAVLIPPLEALQHRIARLVELQAPEVVIAHERAQLAGLEAEPPPPPAWPRAMHYPTCAVDYPGHFRMVDLAQRSAIVALPIWISANREDSRPVFLLADLAGASVSGRAGSPALRDELEKECYGKHPPHVEAALRTVVLAHDLAVQSDRRVDQNEIEDLLFWAWEEASPKQTGVGSGKTPIERRRKLLRWWLDFAAPIAGARDPIRVTQGEAGHEHDHDHDHEHEGHEH
jgi:hypothetical protein